MKVGIETQKRANRITRAYAGGPRQLPIRRRWAARVAQLPRWPEVRP